jgi:hypothetical protein
MATDYTPEVIERITSMWQAGHSATQIARVVPGATRNSIIGKVHRMGFVRGPALQSQIQGSRIRERSLTKKIKIARRDTPPPGRVKAAAEYVDRPVDKPPLPPLQIPHEVTILELGAHQCRSVEDGLFCGRPTCDRGSGSYCEDHAKRYYAGRHRSSYELSPADRARRAQGMRLLWKSRADQRKKAVKVA